MLSFTTTALVTMPFFYLLAIPTSEMIFLSYYAVVDNGGCIIPTSEMIFILVIIYCSRLLNVDNGMYKYT